MAKSSFPSFGLARAGTHVTSLKNYNLPDFILKKIAKDTNSSLLERGKIEDRLQSMNDTALETLHKVFVDCEEDAMGKFAIYRFWAYISSLYHKCEILIDDKIKGASGKNHKVHVAAKSNGMYIAIAFNKSTGNAVSKKEVQKFYDVVDDIKKGEHGTMLMDGVYGSSVGFKGDSLVLLEKLSKSRKNDIENRLDFKIAVFENRIYSVTKC